MNKKTRLILGVSIVIILLGYLFLNTIVSKQYEVSDARAARETLVGKPPITVNGSLVLGSDHWNPETRTLTFKMTDGIATMDVVYTGDKPNMPPEATNIQTIVTGQFKDNVFEAYMMLTKCPSKYQGELSPVSNSTK